MTAGGRGFRHLVRALGLALAVAACNGSATPPATVRPVLPGPTPTVTTYVIGTQAWIDGFEITVVNATASLDPKGGTLAVQTTITNAGRDEATLGAPIVVTAGDATFQLTHGIDLPDLTPGSTAPVTLSFDVIGRGSVDDAVIRIGRDSDHRIAIPLRPATTDLVTFRPIDISVTATGRTPNYRVTIRKIEIRWDLPDWHDELPLSSEALTVTYDVSYTGTFSGGVPFTGDNIGLRLPDGSRLPPRQDGHSQSVALIGAGKTLRGLFSRFEIPSGTTGRFMLLVKDGSTTRPVAFTIAP